MVIEETPEEKIETTPEEQTAEQEVLKGANEDELRQKLSDKFGLDPDTDSELLDKLVEDKKADHEKLSGAIRQKIKLREKLQSSQPKPKVNPEAGKPQPGQDSPSVDDRVKEILEERDLEELKLSEELEAEVKKIAKLQGISVRKAAQDPYFLFKKEEAEKAERILKATPKRSGRGTQGTVQIDPSKPVDPEQYDMNSPEGVKAYRDARALREKHKAQANS